MITRRSALILSLAALCVLSANPADAKGGGLQPKANKDFRELIVKGERPEIVACMVAAIDYVKRGGDFSAIRWDDDASDRALMRESESNGRLTRFVRFATQLRTRGSNLFSNSWQAAEISCIQPEDGAPQVQIKLVGR